MDNYKDFQPSRIVPVALSDAKQAEIPNMLRVTNKDVNWATLVVHGTNNKGNVNSIIQFPPGTVTFEPGQYDTIFATGSTAISATFIVHGYYDIPRQ